jgi:hypothetical protein
MRGTASFIAAAILALVAACGGSESRGAAAGESREGGPAAGAGEYHPPRDLSQMDACALLPPAEIPARFGAVTEGPSLTRGPNGWPTCSYVLAPNTGLIIELIEAYMYDVNRGVWDPERIQTVDGVGEKAFLVGLKPPSDPYLVAAKGDIAVKVTTRNLELARETAQKVLAKL